MVTVGWRYSWVNWTLVLLCLGTQVGEIPDRWGWKESKYLVHDELIDIYST